MVLLRTEVLLVLELEVHRQMFALTLGQEVAIQRSTLYFISSSHGIKEAQNSSVYDISLRRNMHFRIEATIVFCNMHKFMYVNRYNAHED